MSPDTPTLYQRVLQDRFATMPEPVRALHSVQEPTVYSGRCVIEGAANLVGWLAARLLGFPVAGRDVPVSVVITPRQGSEHWQRTFGTVALASTLSDGARPREMLEALWPARVRLAIEPHQEGLDMRVLDGTMARIPLPRWMLPWTRALERVDAAGRFTFDVEIGMPIVGRLVHYRGWLVRAGPQPAG